MAAHRRDGPVLRPLTDADLATARELLLRDPVEGGLMGKTAYLYYDPMTLPRWLSTRERATAYSGGG